MSLPLVLLAYAVVAAGVVPVALDTWVLVGRSPRAALVLLVAGFTASATAACAAVLVGIDGVWESLVSRLTGLPEAQVRRDIGLHHIPLLDFAALLVIAVLGVRLAVTSYVEYARVRAVRRSDLEHLDRIAPVVPGEAASWIRLVLHESRVPMSYWTAGGGTAHLVVTTGTLRALSGLEREALLFRVRTHVRQRHHWLLWWAALPGRAFPWSRLFSRTARHVGRLVEMAADDSAARRYGATAVGGSLRFAGATFLLGESASICSRDDVDRRIARLFAPRGPRSIVASAVGAIVAVVLLAVPLLLAFGPVLGPG